MTHHTRWRAIARARGLSRRRVRLVACYAVPNGLRKGLMYLLSAKSIGEYMRLPVECRRTGLDLPVTWRRVN
jgi:hypothetical protein